MTWIPPLTLRKTVTLLNYGRVIVDGDRDAVDRGMSERARCILASERAQF